MTFKYFLISFLFISFSSNALEEISDESLASVSGQNGVNLSGELNLNENGGPLTSSDAGNAGVWGTCTEKQAATVERCGARLAVQPSENGGWIALDEMKGKLSFEGLTLRSRAIDGAMDDFGGDEVAADGKTVLEIGLPDKVKFENFQYSVVTSSQARPTDVGYTQQVRHGVNFNGSVNMQGNLLVFPTGNP
ncbi:hypothetical protein QNI23_003375 [Bermanella sp. WJH001]|uniref:hypothetical protein n=1 Tax=Bermanella sp. WJH001 TaxID=3048005 RepID=UPI0024BE8050|nr:hypothetical protein [Bermanella sp. WJH001]MDJ1539522.1 hypothetical protein [Bermanella sp. WJH001]